MSEQREMLAESNESTPGPQHPASPWRRLIIPALVFLLVTMGCSAAGLVSREPGAPTPVPTHTLAATFTPTPEIAGEIIIITPPAGNEPGVIIIPPGMDPSLVLPMVTPQPPVVVTATPSSSSPLVTVGPMTPQPPAPAGPTATPTPTWTPTETPTFTPTATPTPYIEVPSGLVSLRTGPGLAYPLVAQLGPEIPVAIIGQNPEGTWYQICCVNNQAVWVAKSSVNTVNDASKVALVAAETPPTPTPTGTPTMTPTPTWTPTPTPYPFERAIGPQFFPTNNQFLTIWVKLFVGPLGQEDPAEGYFLKVLFEGVERPQTNVVRPSFDHFEESAPPGAGNRVEYNYKYEYTPPNPDDLERCHTGTPLPECTDRLKLLGEGTWTMFVIDGAGNQLSDEVTFTTRANNPNREIYVGWRRIR